MSTNLILIGRITGAHGIRGAVKIRSLAANPADIAKYGPLQTPSGSTVEILRMKLANSSPT
jgi:16S rRNA processing protein RimM